jgi:hypothetical protein
MSKIGNRLLLLFLLLFGLIYIGNPLYNLFSRDRVNSINHIRSKDFKLPNEPSLSAVQVKNTTINSNETWSGNILVTKSITVSKVLLSQRM